MSAEAEAAIERANAALEEASFAAAAEAFDAAAELEHAAGRTLHAAHATRFAASSWRLSGRLDAAAERASAAASLTEPGSPPNVAARMEEAEALLALGDAAAAVATYTRALDEGGAAGMPAAATAVLRRRRATARVASGDAAGAAADLRAATKLHAELGDAESALRARVDEVAYLHAGGRPEQSARLAGAARRAAEAAGDHRALADLDLLAATRALDRRDVPRARQAAGTAREHALAATDPMLYLGAAVAVAELAEIAGDRVAAYESLAVGLVTLADLLGRDLARQCFEPPLLAQRERWGADGFASAKGAYEARRREAQRRS